MFARVRADWMPGCLLAAGAPSPAFAELAGILAPPLRKEIGPAHVLRAMRAAVPAGADTFFKDGRFAEDEAAGNTIRFTRDGPPATARLDGETHAFYR